MNLLLAVIDDLYRFAVGVLFGFPNQRTPSITTSRVADDIIYVVPRPEKLALEGPRVDPLESVVRRAAARAPAVPHAHLETLFEPLISLPKKNTIAYVSSSGAPLRSLPLHGVDTVIDHIPFGSMIVAVEEKDGWVRVFYAGHEGYVELADLSDRAAYVHPQFTIGGMNTAHDPSTERLRAMISDEFSYGEGDSPLQAEEYVLYKLGRNGIVPVWPKVRPRVPGTWHALLGRDPQVVIGTTPQARGIMEWLFPEKEGFENSGQKGHIAFVEAVFPDGSVRLSEANWPCDGIYNERIMVEAEWKELNPTFISFKPLSHDTYR